MPKVSVIIPVYNTEKYLPKCLDSVCHQTLSDMEIICVNDCSSDNSLGILKEYQKHDGRIKIIDFKENRGVAVARNNGIKAAGGEYIGFVDSDDYIDLDFYEKLYTEAVKTGADAVKGTMRCTDSNREAAYNRNNLIKKNLAYFYDSFTTAIYRKDFIKDNGILFPEGVNYFEDPHFSIIAGLKYKTVSVVDSANYYYVIRNDSLVNSHDEHNVDKGLDLMRSLAETLNTLKVDKKHYIIVYTYIASQIIVISYASCYSPSLMKKSISYLSEVIKNCKYKDECLEEYFVINRDIQKKIHANNIRKRILNGK